MTSHVVKSETDLSALHGHAMTAQNQLDMLVELLCEGEPLDAQTRRALQDIQATASFVLHQAGHMTGYTPQGVAAAVYRGRE